ncbi:hypothetical protein JHK87_051716 [Glycine soja]|nr:hypothetical protein JHK87_051716 [Glycine soja]
MPGTTNPLVVERVIGDVLEPFASSIPLRVVYNKNKEVINIEENVFTSSGWRQNYIMTRDFAYNLGLPVAARDRVLLLHLVNHHASVTTITTLVITDNIMVNPDAPSPSDPHMKEYLHWTSIPSSPVANTNPEHLTSWELHPNFLKKALKIAGKTEKLIDSSFDVQENLDDGDCFSLDWVVINSEYGR